MLIYFLDFAFRVSISVSLIRLSGLLTVAEIKGKQQNKCNTLKEGERLKKHAN